MGISKPKPVFRTDPDSADGPGLPAVLAALRSAARDDRRAALERRGLPAGRALGVAMREVRALANELGHDHGLACGLWVTGIHEARLLAALVEEPDAVTAAQMDTWARDFEDPEVVDAVCTELFDRTPHAWRKAEEWCRDRREAVRRAGFALLRGLSVQDRTATDSAFADTLRWVGEAATDPRPLVKQAVAAALAAVGRRSRPLHAAARRLADRLAAHQDPSAAEIGRHAGAQLRKS